MSLSKIGTNMINAAYILPTSDGSAGQTLVTDGLGNVTFETPSGGGVVVYMAGAESITAQTLSAEIWTDVTGLTLTRAPSSAGNKVRVRAVVQVGSGTTNVVAIRLMRDATPIAVGSVTGLRTAVSAACIITAINSTATLAAEIDDTPATTSSTTWKVQFIMLSGGGGSAYINRPIDDTNADYTVRCSSSLTITEFTP